MACELPVVSTTAGALPEVVGPDGCSGRLVPPRDPQALAKAITELMHNPAECRAKGQAARERVLKEFTWKSSAERLVEVYREVISAYH